VRKLPSKYLPDIGQSEADERIGMDIEVTHAALKPEWQYIRGHERASDLAGGTNLPDRKIDPLPDRLRPPMPPAPLTSFPCPRPPISYLPRSRAHSPQGNYSPLKKRDFPLGG
jgi:hypothetical protein